jgi:hypothetical protein
MRVKDVRFMESRSSEEAYRAHAAYYVLILRTRGLAPAEIARRVIAMYPRVRPELERFTREPVVDPLRGGYSGC